MGKKTIFSALSSQTRINIIKLLLKNEMHISALARTLHLSVPVVSRHVKILEGAELIEKKTIGNAHVFHVKPIQFEHLFEPLIDPLTVEIDKNESLYEALQQLPFISIKKYGDDKYIASIDGEEGYYVYEVNGKKPDVPVNAFKPSSDVTVILSKLIALHQKRINIKIKKKSKK